jgi:hypothetical protein
MDPLFSNANPQGAAPTWMAKLMHKVKELVRGVNQDMQDFDTVVNEFVFGRMALPFDGQFLKMRHRGSIEWRAFEEQRGGPKVLSDAHRTTILHNQPHLQSLHSEMIVDDKTFWDLWQLHRFLQDVRRRSESPDAVSLLDTSLERSSAQAEWESWE